MNVLYRVDSSIQGTESVTREITDEFERAWTAANPNGKVTRRDLLTTPVSPATWAESLATHGTVAPTAAEQAAAALATNLADEILAADVIVIGAPLYNWGPSPHVLCWIDMLWTEARFAPRTYPLARKPVVLVTAQGGDDSRGGPRDGWNHSLPYLTHNLGPHVFGGDITLIDTPLTLAGHSPALAQFTGRATELRAESHRRAREVAANLAVDIAA